MSKTKLLLAVCFFILNILNAQEATPPTIFQVQNAQLKAIYKEPFDRKREVVFNNKKFRVYNNYFSGGAGKCYNSGWNQWEFCPAIDYNFHLRKQYFQFGGLLSGPGLGNNNCLNIHACWGYRFERSNYMLAAYGGASYTGGNYLKTINDTIYALPFRTIGAYVALQCFYKIKFDYGLGLTAFIDINAIQTLTGIRAELFLSGAYRGLKRKDYAKEENN